MPSLVHLFLAQLPDTARVPLEPLSAWIPHTVAILLLLIFAGLYWRAENRRNADRMEAEDHRYKNLKLSVESLGNFIQEMRLDLAGCVSVDAHRSSVKDLHDKYNDLSQKMAVVLDRTRES